MKNFILGFITASLLFMVSIGILFVWQPLNKAVNQTSSKNSDKRIIIAVDEKGLVTLNGESVGTVFDTNQLRARLKQLVVESREKRKAAAGVSNSPNAFEAFNEDVVLSVPFSLKSEVVWKIRQIVEDETGSGVTIQSV